MGKINWNGIIKKIICGKRLESTCINEYNVDEIKWDKSLSLLSKWKK